MSYRFSPLSFLLALLVITTVLGFANARAATRREDDVSSFPLKHVKGEKVIIQLWKESETFTRWKSSAGNPQYDVVSTPDDTIFSLQDISGSFVSLAIHHVPFSPPRIKSLIGGLSLHNNIKILSLEGNDIDDETIAALAQAIGRLHGLEHLWLNDNKIGVPGTKALVEALSMPNLRLLNLSDNNLGDDAEGLKEVFRTLRLDALVITNSGVRPEIVSELRECCPGIQRIYGSVEDIQHKWGAYLEEARDFQHDPLRKQ